MYLTNKKQCVGKAAEPGRNGSEKGFLSFSGILMFLVLGALIFLAFKLLPPYINNYQFQDSLNTIARNATYGQTTEAAIRKDILTEARQLSIPIDDSDLKVTKAGVTVDISTQYTITVDLLVRKVDLEFAPSAGNRNIMAKP
jgi:Flp pilus assembly protein TadG